MLNESHFLVFWQQESWEDKEKEMDGFFFVAVEYEEARDKTCGVNL